MTVDLPRGLVSAINDDNDDMTMITRYEYDDYDDGGDYNESIKQGPLTVDLPRGPAQTRHMGH